MGNKNTACKVNLVQQLQTMESGSQGIFPFKELVFNTPVAITDIQKEKGSETASTPVIEEKNVAEISSTPTTEIKSEVETEASTSVQDKAKDTNIGFWVLGILGILFLTVTAVIIIKTIKRKNRS